MDKRKVTRNKTSVINPKTYVISDSEDSSEDDYKDYEEVKQILSVLQKYIDLGIEKILTVDNEKKCAMVMDQT